MIQIEPTPNPDSLKFLSEKTISSIGTEEFRAKDKDKVQNIFVKDLLKFEGVELVLLSEKFITVKKDKKASWDVLKPMVISHINDYYQRNEDPILKNKDVSLDKINKNDDEIVEKIKDVLDTKIRPAVARDGGDIKFKSFKDGVVHVELQGSCSGCPSSVMTLKQGVQNLLKHYIREVQSVEAI